MHTRAWAGYFLLVGGLMLLLTGLWFLAEAAAFLEDTKRTHGTVVALDRKKNVKGFDQDHPVVPFTSPETGETIEFTSRFGLWPSPFTVSDRVEIAYDPSSPQRARINSFWTIWFLPLLLVAFGLACGVAGCHTLRARIKYRRAS